MVGQSATEIEVEEEDTRVSGVENLPDVVCGLAVAQLPLLVHGESEAIALVADDESSAEDLALA